MAKHALEFNKYIIFSVYADGGALAWHLQNEGKEVVLAQVNDIKTVGIKKPEDGETKKRRLTPFNGMLTKKKAEDLIKEMEKISNKDEYFVIFDFNSLYAYAEKATKMGFRHGIFPTKFDYDLENDRKWAKEFVQKHYPDLKVAEVEEYKTIEEGIEMIEGSEEFWALKGNDVECQTVVPGCKDLDFARAEIIDALKSHKEDYERQGYILERQIRDGIEFCPQIVFYDGVPLAYSVDLEQKAIGSGNTGPKVGCTMNIMVEMDPDAPIVRKAFPPAVYKLAASHKGLFFTDANIILKDGDYYYLEFCQNRFGYDAIQTECEMAGGVSNYFEALANGENPYQSKFGVAVRGLNMHRDHDGRVMNNMAMRWQPEVLPHLWPFDMHKNTEKGGYENGGYEYDLLCVFTASSDDLEYAIKKCYENINKFSFDEMYYRSQGDFVDRTYPSNLLDRYDAIESIISSPVDEE